MEDRKMIIGRYFDARWGDITQYASFSAQQLYIRIIRDYKIKGVWKSEQSQG